MCTQWPTDPQDNATSAGSIQTTMGFHVNRFFARALLASFLSTMLRSQPYVRDAPVFRLDIILYIWRDHKYSPLT
jgi:hypothetical protein